MQLQTILVFALVLVVSISALPMPTQDGGHGGMSFGNTAGHGGNGGCDGRGGNGGGSGFGAGGNGGHGGFGTDCVKFREIQFEDRKLTLQKEQHDADLKFQNEVLHSDKLDKDKIELFKLMFGNK